MTETLMTDKELRVLSTICAATEERELCSLSIPAIHDRNWFGVQFRRGFDQLLEDGLIEASTEFVITDAGRAALTKAMKAGTSL